MSVGTILDNFDYKKQINGNKILKKIQKLFGSIFLSISQIGGAKLKWEIYFVLLSRDMFWQVNR